MTIFIVLLLFIFAPASTVSAATTPDLGGAEDFGILSSTYTNTVAGTTINGSLGYTTGPATAPTVSGTTHVADATYSTAGTDQGAALTALNAQSCDFSFGLATDLSLVSQPLTPGVYCVTGATSIGTGGITLTGAGTYIFRSTGALDTTANSSVTLSGGASACDVFWTPGAATTLGANTTFAGTNIDNAGITIGSTVSWTGRALAFGGTVSTTTDTITTPTCPAPTATPGPTATPTPTPSPTPIPTTTPTVTPTPPSSETSFSSSSSGGGPAPCVSSPITTVSNVIEAKRTSPTSVFVSWGPNAGLSAFFVQYGFQNGTWTYTTLVSGFSTTIGSLPANQSVWVRVAATDNCAVGTYSEPVSVAGISRANSPGFPNTGNPRLPNTGIGPKPKSISPSILTRVLQLFLSLPLALQFFRANH